MKPQKTDQVHKKKYYDIGSVQLKLGLLQRQVDEAWESRKPPEPVFLVKAKGTNWWMSTYEE